MIAYNKLQRLKLKQEARATRLEVSQGHQTWLMTFVWLYVQGRRSWKGFWSLDP